MTATTRTTRRKPSIPAAIQTKEKLANLARDVFTFAQNTAYERGISDFESNTRDHPLMDLQIYK